MISVFFTKKPTKPVVPLWPGGGPGLPVFNTDLFSLMTGGDIDVQDFTSVVDSDVRAIFLQVTIYSDQSANC